MSTLSIHDIELKPAQLKAIRKRARQEGKTPPEYIRGLIERDLLAGQSFDEILKPIREDVRQRGMDERQIDGLVDRARRATRHKSRGTSR